MKDAIEISLNSIGISVINDILREDLFYISINPSKELWIDRNDLYSKPISPKLNKSLEHHYKHYLGNESKSNSYEIDQSRVSSLLLLFRSDG